jgi:hypothetical protein
MNTVSILLEIGSYVINLIRDLTGESEEDTIKRIQDHRKTLQDKAAAALEKEKKIISGT